MELALTLKARGSGRLGLRVEASKAFWNNEVEGLPTEPNTPEIGPYNLRHIP